MTNEEIIELGRYSETLLGDPMFSALADHFEKASAMNILNTKPEDFKTRENVYYVFNGFRDFLGLMKTFVDEKDKLETMADFNEEQD